MSKKTTKNKTGDKNGVKSHVNNDYTVTVNFHEGSIYAGNGNTVDDMSYIDAFDANGLFLSSADELKSVIIDALRSVSNDRCYIRNFAKKDESPSQKKCRKLRKEIVDRIRLLLDYGEDDYLMSFDDGLTAQIRSCSDVMQFCSMVLASVNAKQADLLESKATSDRKPEK